MITMAAGLRLQIQVTVHAIQLQRKSRPATVLASREPKPEGASGETPTGPDPASLSQYPTAGALPASNAAVTGPPDSDFVHVAYQLSLSASHSVTSHHDMIVTPGPPAVRP